MCEKDLGLSCQSCSVFHCWEGRKMPAVGGEMLPSPTPPDLCHSHWVSADGKMIARQVAVLPCSRALFSISWLVAGGAFIQHSGGSSRSDNKGESRHSSTADNHNGAIMATKINTRFCFKVGKIIMTLTGCNIVQCQTTPQSGWLLAKLLSSKERIDITIELPFSFLML